MEYKQKLAGHVKRSKVILQTCTYKYNNVTCIIVITPPLRIFFEVEMLTYHLHYMLIC